MAEHLLTRSANAPAALLNLRLKLSVNHTPASLLSCPIHSVAGKPTRRCADEIRWDGQSFPYGIRSLEMRRRASNTVR